MAHRFNAPPGWPVDPGWAPPENWQVPPSWPSAPPDWQWWVEDSPTTPEPPASTAVPRINPDLQQLLDTSVAAVANTDPGKGSRKARLEAQLQSLTLFSERMQRALSSTVGELRDLGALEASELQVEIARRKAMLEHLETTAEARKTAISAEAENQVRLLKLKQKKAGTELHRIGILIEQAKVDLVETRDSILLQEVGIYEYTHPLEDAVSYKAKLESIKKRYKALAKDDRAIDSISSWQVNGSSVQGKKMVRETSKLMLRAYNAEADNLVRTLKPFKLDSAVNRLGKTRETITRLGTTMQMRITEQYHRLRVEELQLTADYLAKAAEEKERIREERAREREEEKAQREMLKERAKLEKERAHLQAAIASLSASGDDAAVAELTAKLDQVDAAFEDVLTRQANSATGYVYVISNRGAFGPEMVKIGMTRRLEPMDRVNELGDASVPFRFDVHALVFSEDAAGWKPAFTRRSPTSGSTR